MLFSRNCSCPLRFQYRRTLPSSVMHLRQSILSTAESQRVTHFKVWPLREHKGTREKHEIIQYTPRKLYRSYDSISRGSYRCLSQVFNQVCRSDIPLLQCKRSTGAQVIACVKLGAENEVEISPQGRPCSLRLEKVESKINSCAVKSYAKNLRGMGRERRLIFLWLFYFRDVVMATKY